MPGCLQRKDPSFERSLPCRVHVVVVVVAAVIIASVGAGRAEDVHEGRKKMDERSDQMPSPVP